jgi:hypothetical protein
MIKTHEELVMMLYNLNIKHLDVHAEGEKLYVFTKWNEYIIKFIDNEYVIALNHNHAQTVSKDKSYKAVKNTILITVDTPQEVYDYFKPFMS